MTVPMKLVKVSTDTPYFGKEEETFLPNQLPLDLQSFVSLMRKRSANKIIIIGDDYRTEIEIEYSKTEVTK